MENKYLYYIMPKAKRDLHDIGEYIMEELQHPKAAKDFFIKFSEKIDVLLQFPFSGQLIDNKHIADTDLRKIVVGNYIVFYKPDEQAKTIIIVRIIHGSRNIDKALKTMKTK